MFKSALISPPSSEIQHVPFFPHNLNGVIVVTLVKIAEDAGKERELEHHLNNGIEAISSEAHVVHKPIIVPALTIRDVVHGNFLPEDPEGPEDRGSAHVSHNAFKERQVEEAHHEPHEAHWREELNLCEVPGLGEGNVHVTVEQDVDQNSANAVDHTIHTVIVHALAVVFVANEATNGVLKISAGVATVHLSVTHTY